MQDVAVSFEDTVANNLNIDVYPGTAIVAISTKDTVARQSEYFRLPGDSRSHLDEDIVAVQKSFVENHITVR